MIIMNSSITPARYKLFHLRLQHLSDCLRRRCPVFVSSKQFQHRRVSHKSETCNLPTYSQHFAFHRRNHSGYVTYSTSSRQYACASLLANHMYRLSTQCRLHRGASLLCSDSCSYYHARQLSVSVERFANDSKSHDFTESHNKNIVKKLQGMEDSLRYHGYSTVRIGLFFMFTFGMCLYIFRESIRENVADEVSQVATRSLEDQVVVGKAEQFAKGLLDAIMNDDQMTQLAAEFVVGVLQREETKQATARVLLSVVDDPQTREHLIMATKQVFLAALNDEETQSALKMMLKSILADDETRQATKDLLAYVFAEDDVKTLVADFFKDVIRMEVVIKQATELGKDVTHNVITDPVIQQETGDTMWRAFTYSITPRWFGGSTPPPKETSPPKTTSPETGEPEAANITKGAVEDEEQDKKGIEGKKDIKDAPVAIQEKEIMEEVEDEQQRKEQEEITQLTLIAEDN